MLEKVIDIISEYQGIDKSKINEDSMLISDLGLSSFDVVSLSCKLEDEFDVEIPDRQIRTIQSVKDIVDFIEKNK